MVKDKITQESLRVNAEDGETLHCAPMACVKKPKVSMPCAIFDKAQQNFSNKHCATVACFRCALWFTLRKHQESQENDGAWTRRCLRTARSTKRTYVTKNLPIPHPKHNCRNRAREHNVQANFTKFWRSSLPIRGIRSCGIKTLSNFAPHLKQSHMLAL